MNLAVADLGTNTFHLLVTDQSGKALSISEYPVLLGQQNPKEQYINVEALQRAEKALLQMQSVLKTYKPAHFRVVATSAIRTASNAAQVQDIIFNYLQIQPELIPGDTEAQYIYSGVWPTIPETNQNILVMDIGGGSTEFIIGCGNQILWKQSFLLGAARLKSLFPVHFPASASEIKQIEIYISEMLHPLFEMIQLYKPAFLVGAAGAFETLSSISGAKTIYGQSVKLSKEQWPEIYKRIIEANDAALLHMPGMPSFRAPMMIYAMELIRIVINFTQPVEIYMSSASLKEGILMEMLEIKY